MIGMPEAGAALLLGLSGAGHCVGMCGGIASALQLAGNSGTRSTLAYHCGRILSYTLLGAVFGWLAGTIESSTWTIGLRYLAAALLVGMGLYVADWWRGMAQLEKIGAALFSPLQRKASSLVSGNNADNSFALGLLWGLIPCGLIYSSLTWAVASANAFDAALLMLLFGVGTLPAMLAVSLGAARVQVFLRRRGLKSVIGMLLIAGGLWTGYLAYQHAQHAAHGMPREPGVQQQMHQHH